MKRIVCFFFVLAGACMAQKYTPQGELIFPSDYRHWVYLSSGLGMSYSNNPNANPSFSNVYANPAAYDAFLKTGTWPDKTVLLLESRASGSNASNRDGKFQAALLGFEAHVKDASRGGWTFYSLPIGAASGKAFPKTASCYSCHEKTGATDTTFVQFYPSLIETAVAKGTYRKPEE